MVINCNKTTAVCFVWYKYTIFCSFCFTLFFTSILIIMKVFAAFILLILFPCYFCSFTCDKICTQNQVYSSKVSQCQNTCWNRKFNETSKCQTSPGCVCRSGFVRHPDTYDCILEHQCPKQTNHAQCGKNEVYLICTSNSIGCEKTCDTRKEDSKKCLCKSGCTCKNGYVRSSVTFQCIPSTECESMIKCSAL